MIENNSVDIQLENQPGKKRGPRKIYVIAFFIATLAFLITSLPEALLGKDAGFPELLVQIRKLERKIFNVTGLSDYKLPKKIILCDQEIPIDDAPGLA